MASVKANETLVKQPGEVLVYDMDFAALLAVGETITGTPVVLIVPEQAVNEAETISAGTPALNEDADTVQVEISGGIHRHDYEVQITVETSESRTRQGDGPLRVID